MSPATDKPAKVRWKRVRPGMYAAGHDGQDLRIMLTLSGRWEILGRLPMAQCGSTTHSAVRRNTSITC